MLAANDGEAGQKPAGQHQNSCCSPSTGSLGTGASTTAVTSGGRSRCATEETISAEMPHHSMFKAHSQLLTLYTCFKSLLFYLFSLLQLRLARLCLSV